MHIKNYSVFRRGETVMVRAATPENAALRAAKIMGFSGAKRAVENSTGPGFYSILDGLETETKKSGRMMASCVAVVQVGEA